MLLCNLKIECKVEKKYYLCHMFLCAVLCIMYVCAVYGKDSMPGSQWQFSSFKKALIPH